MAEYGMKKNKEGYNDPTAYKGMMAVLREEVEQRRLNHLINFIKRLVDEEGYELLNRIELRDRRTGKEYR